MSGVVISRVSHPPNAATWAEILTVTPIDSGSSDGEPFFVAGKYLLDDVDITDLMAGSLPVVGFNYGSILAATLTLRADDVGVELWASAGYRCGSVDLAGRALGLIGPGGITFRDAAGLQALSTHADFITVDVQLAGVRVG